MQHCNIATELLQAALATRDALGLQDPLDLLASMAKMALMAEMAETERMEKCCPHLKMRSRASSALKAQKDPLEKAVRLWFLTKNSCNQIR